MSYSEMQNIAMNRLAADLTSVRHSLLLKHQELEVARKDIQLTREELRNVQILVTELRTQLTKEVADHANRALSLATYTSQNTDLLAKLKKRNWEIERLRSLCSEHGIDPRCMEEPLMRTKFINPLLPFRHMDWVAWLDRPEDKTLGHGATQQEAMKDLEWKLNFGGPLSNTALEDKIIEGALKREMRNV